VTVFSMLVGLAIVYVGRMVVGTDGYGSDSLKLHSINLYMLLGVEVFNYLLISSINYKFTFRIFPMFALTLIFNFILRFFYDKSISG
jgi:hypothetical protein